MTLQTGHLVMASAGGCVQTGGQGKTWNGPDGGEVARGLTRSRADDLRSIRGRHSSAIRELLGYEDDLEVVHRDDLGTENTWVNPDHRSQALLKAASRRVMLTSET